MTTPVPPGPQPASGSQFILPDGTIHYVRPTQGGGKCFTPMKAKPNCQFHRYSSSKLPSRCIHPTMGQPLDKKKIDAITSCPGYEPDPANAQAILGTVQARAGVPTGDDKKDEDILIQVRRQDKAAKAASGGKAISADAFKSQLFGADDVRIGGEILPKFDMTGLSSDRALLVPKLPFTYQDNVHPIQGSVLAFVARAAADNDIAVLSGHLGTGKTTAVQRVAEMVGAPLVIINCDGQLPVEHIIGSRVPAIVNGATELEWRDAPLLQAYREGLWAVIDDYTFTGSEVFSAIFGLMTNTNYQVQSTGEVIARNPNFRLFLTTNPPEFVELYPNRQQPDAAFLSRIGSRYFMNWLDEAAELRAMQEVAPLINDMTFRRMQTVIATSRSYLAKQDINFAFSTRHAVNWAKKMARLGDLKWAAYEAFLADLDVDSKEVMLSKILDSQLD